jgi:hypothetical protein
MLPSQTPTVASSSLVRHTVLDTGPAVTPEDAGCLTGGMSAQGCDEYAAHSMRDLLTLGDTSSGRAGGRLAGI